MEQSVVVPLGKKYYEILISLSESWGKDPGEILRFICEKALKTAQDELKKKS